AAGADVAVGSAIALTISTGLPHVSAPSVVGLTQAAATTAITGAQLVVGTISQSSSMTVPAGNVISQSPAAGADVVVGSAIALTVSTGLPHVSAPDVVGLTQTAATSAITSAQLVVGTIGQASSMTVPAGSVISQNPPAGSDVVVGSAIALTVSTGLPHVSAPDVVGLTQAAATSAITSAQLVVGTIGQASSMTVPAGSVISQNPAAGADVVVGSAIALTVSTGLPHVSTPSVVGLTQAAATTAITGAQLVVGTISQASSMTVPAGSVISQSPAAGADVIVGSAIALTVSTGLPHVSAPDVVGLTQAAATSAITGAQLVVGTISQASSMTVPSGSVISQNPAAGADVVVGSAIALTVSTGLPHVGAPDVVGLTQAAATSAITGAQLVVGTISQSSSMTVPAGSVMSQSPAGGADVVVGSAIALTISTGLPHVSAPDVVGLTQAAATTAITGAQLVVGTISQASSMTVPAGSVISQSPAAGADVIVGSAIALTVSTGLPHVSAPDVVGLTQAAATTAITGAQLVVGTISQSSSMTVPAGSVISQNPAAGADVAVGSAIALTVSTGLPHVSAPDVVGFCHAAATT